MMVDPGSIGHSYQPPKHMIDLSFFSSCTTFSKTELLYCFPNIIDCTTLIPFTKPALNGTISKKKVE